MRATYRLHTMSEPPPSAVVVLVLQLLFGVVLSLFTAVSAAGPADNAAAPQSRLDAASPGNDQPGGGQIVPCRKRLQTCLIFRFQRSGSVSRENDTAPTDAFDRWAVRGP